MKSADDIRKIWLKSKLSTNPDKHEAIFEKIRNAYEQARTNELALHRFNIWRNIMKKPIAKLAVAAVLVIVCLTGITIFNRTSSIALADVLSHIEQIGTYTYQMSMTSTGRLVGDRELNSELHGTILISQEYGTRVSTDISTISEMLDPNSEETVSQEIYVLPKEKVLLTIMPNQKKYMRMELDDSLIKQMKEKNYDPHLMVDQILESKYRNLGRKTIDGIEVEGYQTTDPNYQGGMFDRIDVKLWVDVKTRLPVRMEMDLQMAEVHINGDIFNFQWDIPVEAADFEPVIPEEYTTIPGGSVKMPAIDEETAIQGLRLFADLSGRYPDELNLLTLLSQVRKLSEIDTPAANQLKEQSKDLEQEERVKKIMDTMRPLQGLGIFYMLLVQENKDPAYYGNIITPADVDQVLLRWKVADEEYRVIFGDLHVETVTAESLAELEAVLPQVD